MIPGHTTHKLIDNLLQAYRGTRYRYDPHGRLVEKDGPAGRMRFTWNSLDQLVQVETTDTLTRFRYDPLGRRIVKHSEAIVPRSMNDGSQYHRLEVARLGKERQLGRTLYGWEGDRLAWESRDGRSLHYLYEPDSFVPLAQGIDNRPIVLHRTPDWKNREYRVKDDPLWQQHPEAEPFDELAFYHCDQIGMPREMTDGEGKLVWSAHYRAWGEAGILTEKVRNPLRFQDQYYDHETGLHYNRHRYYDPESGRYISKDPIGLAGGMNLYIYVDGNPLIYVDPEGLKGWYCQRPLGKPPGTQGPPLFNHQYLCVTRTDGTILCGGLTTDGNPLSGESRLTRPDEDYYNPESCKEIDDDKDQCFEQCVRRNFNKPNKPRYGIGPLTDCQEYADDIYYGCKILCNMRKSSQ
jgi:RHS repeat-associated protein